MILERKLELLRIASILHDSLVVIRVTRNLDIVAKVSGASIDLHLIVQVLLQGGRLQNVIGDGHGAINNESHTLSFALALLGDVLGLCEGIENQQKLFSRFFFCPPQTSRLPIRDPLHVTCLHN